jgi:hypothetical protein
MESAKVAGGDKRKTSWRKPFDMSEQTLHRVAPRISPSKALLVLLDM